MHIKVKNRVRRGRRTREHLKRLGVEKGTHRMVIHRTAAHIYAQILAPTGGAVLAQASTLDKEVRGETGEGGKVGLSKVVGRILAQRAKQAGIERVACDRAGFKYHGRVAALVEAARENGLVV